MNRSAVRNGVLAVSLLLSVVFGYLAVRNVYWNATWTALEHCSYWWLLPTGVAFAVSVFLRAVRWRSLFRHEERPDLRPIAKAMLVGLFFNTILPARSGEAARIVALKSYSGTSSAETTATVVVERVFDVLSLLALLFVCVPWLPHVTWLRAAAVVALIAIVGVLILVVLVAQLGRGAPRKLVGILTKLPFLTDAVVVQLVASVVDGLAALRRPRQAAAGLAWTILSWVVLGLAFWFLIIGFHLHLSVLAGLLVVIATGLSFIVPAAPGGVGVFEAAGLAATSAYGISHSRAIAYILVLHAVNLVPFLVAGLVVLASGQWRPRRRLSSPFARRRRDVEPRNRQSKWIG
jgi:glycosyltransferase 2 family protein